MCASQELQMQEAALAQPDQALLVVGVTRASSKDAVQAAFMEMYCHVNGGSADNPISIQTVDRAVQNWFAAGKITPWIARGCVLKERQSVAP